LQTSNSLTKEALRIFNICGFHAWRQNNGGVYDAKIKAFRANSSTPGISDILGYNKNTGRILAAEIKAGKDKLSPAQIVFLDGIKKAGGAVFVIRTVDDITAILKKYNGTQDKKG
jgi:hypothetical protein